MANRTKFTLKRKKQFLESLRRTANIALSARACNVSRRCAYDHKEEDEDFSKEWDDAIEEAVDLLEAEARRRAFEGTEKPVYQSGQLVGYVREYSDTLTIFLLKGHRPEKYRERSSLELTGDGTVKVSWTNLDQIKNAEGPEGG